MPVPKHKKAKKKKPQRTSRQRKPKPQPIPRKRKPKPKTTKPETPPTQVRPRRIIDLSADPTLTDHETSRVISHCVNRQNGNVSLLVTQIEEDGSQSIDIMEIQDTPNLRTRTHKTILVGDSCASIQIIEALPATGDYLLVSRQCQYRPDGMSDRNGIIVNGEGVVNEITLGHGIRKVCVTETNTIWVGYGDEGIGGGWDESLGGLGLVAFDTTGNVLYKFDDSTEYGDIRELHAMNIISDSEVWVYLNESVVRVSLESGIVCGIKDIGVYGEKYLVVSDDKNRIALQSGEKFPLTQFTVLDVGQDSFEKRCEIMLVDEDGKEWEAGLEIFGNRAVGFKENCVFFFDLVL